MSALGHKRTFAMHRPMSAKDQKRTFALMSALPPKADMCGANRNVRFGPKADIAETKKKDRLAAVFRNGVCLFLKISCQ